MIPPDAFPGIVIGRELYQVFARVRRRPSSTLISPARVTSGPMERPATQPQVSRRRDLLQRDVRIRREPRTVEARSRARFLRSQKQNVTGIEIKIGGTERVVSRSARRSNAKVQRDDVADPGLEELNKNLIQRAQALEKSRHLHHPVLGHPGGKLLHHLHVALDGDREEQGDR